MYDKIAGIDRRILNNMEPVFVRNTIRKVWEPGVILNRLNPIVDINGKVFYRTRGHLKPRSNNMPREVNEHFELPIQPHTPIPSSSTDIPPVSTAKPSTPAKAQTPTSPPQPTTPVKFKSPVKPNVETEKASYQPRSFTTRSGRTTQVPSKFKD